MVESIPKFVGMAYAVLGTVALVVLLRKGRFSRRKGYIFLAVSSLMGFLVFAPMLPYQFQALILGNTQQLAGPIAVAILMLVAFVVLAFAFGRVFCGYVCPIGAVQELLSRLPVRKVRIGSKALPIGVRLGVFMAFVVLATAASVGMLRYIGVRDFFYLEAGSAFFYVFLGLALLSIFLYRPVCRFLCPYGVFLSLAAGGSRFRRRRTGDCKDCGKCERACPTGEAARPDRKQECYLCYRCSDVCPQNALVYARKEPVRAPGKPADTADLPEAVSLAETGDVLEV